VDWGASWSPDGARIAFASDRDGNWEIYLMNADGGQQQRITINEATDQDPDWRPN
jgi:Tol biopolymer transport system component